MLPIPTAQDYLPSRSPYYGLEDFPQLVDRAKSEMGLSGVEKASSKGILHVGISNPISRPKLTVVDLPGLIHFDSKQRSAADVDLISVRPGPVLHEESQERYPSGGLGKE